MFQKGELNKNKVHVRKIKVLLNINFLKMCKPDKGEILQLYSHSNASKVKSRQC